MSGIEIINKTEEFLHTKLISGNYMSSNPAAMAYRLEHSYRVANIGKIIAENEGFDVTETVVACLLHDVSYCEDFGDNGWKEHGRRAAQIARPFLCSLGLSQDRINDMCYGIAIHVDDEADFEGEKTPFALSIGDADNIDRFDVYRIHETLLHQDFTEKSLEEKTEFVRNTTEKLNRLLSMPLGTKTAKRLWEDRISFNLSFYEKLLSQLKNSAEIIL